MYGHHISHHYNIISVPCIPEKPFALFRPDTTTPVRRMHAASFLKIIHFSLDFMPIQAYNIIKDKEQGGNKNEKIQFKQNHEKSMGTG